jgi:REP element-mobilizing transposase RayT
MPEHVHLLISEPERGTLALAIQSLKQGVARRLALREKDSFWQARYYDFNVWSEQKSSRDQVHSSQSGSAWFGSAGRRLGLEQLQALSDR